MARELFSEIRSNVPHLESTVIDGPEVYALHFPEQNGLQFPVDVYLDNGDELHISIGDLFHCSWFPITQRIKRDAVRDGVIGFMEGEWRLSFQERKLFGWSVGREARFQCQVEGKWETIGTDGLPWDAGLQEPAEEFTNNPDA